MNLKKTTFWGYRRENARVGVRNHVVILPLDDLSNAAALAVENNIKGTLALPHPYGRLQFGADLDLFFRTLIGTGSNPNVAAVVVIGIEEEWTKRVVDGIAEKGEVDFVTEVATLLPMHNICDMLGVAEEDRPMIVDIARIVGGYQDPEVMGGREVLPTLFESMGKMREFVAGLIADRRAKPGTDLLTSLTEAEVDGEKLTDDEIISFFGLLLVAGNDTTRQSLSHGMKALSDFPAQRAWLMEDFEGRIATAVEELVRWATPIMTFRRTAARDCELNGTQITKGDKVIMFYTSANWDTEVFDHPEQLDLGRHPNPHITFGGGGIHHCLGNQLARLQIKALWDELLHRLPDIEVCGDMVCTRSNFFHGVNHLPVRFTPES